MHNKEASQMRRTTVMARWTVMLLIVLAAVTAGCSSDSSTSGDSSSDNSTAQEYSIDITQNGQHVADVTLAQLHTLPEVSFTAKEKTQTGPALLSVLQYAGITEFNRVTVAGWSRGRVATAEKLLDKGDITDQVILEFTNQGKTKLAATTIADSEWIIDVEAIRVE
jgi:hypothetical protein